MDNLIVQQMTPLKVRNQSFSGKQGKKMLLMASEDPATQDASLYLTLKNQKKIGPDIVSPMRRKKHHQPKSPASSRRRKQKEEALNQKKDANSNKKKVRFRDEYDGDLCEVILIESYKKYYNNEATSACSCSCTIF